MAKKQKRAAVIYRNTYNVLRKFQFLVKSTTLILP